MENASVEGLRTELALLEAQEAQISAKRRHLHNRIDFRYGTDTAETHEREISEERRRLHGRIDEVRELLKSLEPH